MTEERTEGLIALFKKRMNVFNGVEIAVRETEDDAISITTEIVSELMLLQFQYIVNKIKENDKVSSWYSFNAKNGLIEIKYREL